MSRNKFFLHILAADKPFYEGECVSLVVPTLQGQYGIMAHHSNYISAVVPGELDFTVEEDGKEKRIRAAVSEGIVKVEKNEVLVLRRQSVREYYAAQAKLARAMNRLKVKKHNSETEL